MLRHCGPGPGVEDTPRASGARTDGPAGLASSAMILSKMKGSGTNELFLAWSGYVMITGCVMSFFGVFRLFVHNGCLQSGAILL